MKATENMRIWDALGKTDPAQTKQFTRAGGFKGTAIKPMWANKQMTEFFGPCGIGWGQTEPTFNVVPALDELMVYCTVGMWYMNASIKCGPIYGVGGDKVVVKQSSGIRTDDEAFKKAYTDALSNAMKFIGVAADIHMGLFDDNKYVQSVREEFKEEDEARKKEVFAEVERQKTATNTKLVDVVTPAKTLYQQVIESVDKEIHHPAIPPELDWSYNSTTGVLICRLLEVKKSTKKAGGDYVAMKINGSIDGKEVISYFHKTHQDELLKAAGKVCKFMIVPTKGGYFNVDTVIEIDGVRMPDKPTPPEAVPPSKEEVARWLASTLDYDEESLREVHGSICGGDWAKVVAHLEGVKARREAGDAV